MMTAYTLVILYFFGTKASQSVVVPNLPTLEACQHAASNFPSARNSTITFCVETLR
jgi:hypothetical protein